MPEHTRPGDVLADRYRLTDLLTESEGGRFWRAFDSVLQRDVAVHIIACSDPRAPLLREAAKTSATVLDRRMLRVLDIDEAAERCFVVNEWGSGTSLDILLAHAEPLSPTVAAWPRSRWTSTPTVLIRRRRLRQRSRPRLRGEDLGGLRLR